MIQTNKPNANSNLLSCFGNDLKRQKKNPETNIFFLCFTGFIDQDKKKSSVAQSHYVWTKANCMLDDRRWRCTSFETKQLNLRAHQEIAKKRCFFFVDFCLNNLLRLPERRVYLYLTFKLFFVFFRVWLKINVFSCNVFSKHYHLSRSVWRPCSYAYSNPISYVCICLTLIKTRSKNLGSLTST